MIGQRRNDYQLLPEAQLFPGSLGDGVGVWLLRSCSLVIVIEIQTIHGQQQFETYTQSFTLGASTPRNTTCPGGYAYETHRFFRP